MAEPRFPFTAIVGADDLATALLLSAISPEIGGVLVRGEKGTAKSTMVRALAEVLPQQRVVAGCRFGCDPDREEGCPDGPHDGAATTTRPARLVELPIGASAGLRPALSTPGTGLRTASRPRTSLQPRSASATPWR
mgnify:CR=1 FL=1